MFEVEDNHWWYRALHQIIYKILHKEYMRIGRLKVFDSGCGTGRLCQLLAPLGEIQGCDISELALDFCRKRGVENVVRGDVNDFKLGTNTYDVITSMDVLCNDAVINENHILRAFCDALKPGGILLINLPAFPFLRSSNDRAVHTRHRYRRRELTNMLKEAGYEVEICSYRLCTLFPLIVVHRLIRAYLDRNIPLDKVISDVKPVPYVLNRLLELLVVLEGHVMPVIPLPFGLSVFAVARKPLLLPENANL